MKPSTRRALIALILVSALCLTGCGIADALEVASLATSVAATTISTTSIDPALKTQIVGYLNAVSTALSTAAGDMVNGSLTAEQAASISAALIAAVIPDLPAGTPAIVREVLTAVANGVSAFLNQISSKGITPQAISAQASTGKFYQWHLTAAQVAKIKQAQQHLVDAKKVLATMH